MRSRRSPAAAGLWCRQHVRDALWSRRPSPFWPPRRRRVRRPGRRPRRDVAPGGGAAVPVGRRGAAAAAVKMRPRRPTTGENTPSREFPTDSEWIFATRVRLTATSRCAASISPALQNDAVDPTLRPTTSPSGRAHGPRPARRRRRSSATRSGSPPRRTSAGRRPRSGRTPLHEPSRTAPRLPVARAGRHGAHGHRGDRRRRQRCGNHLGTHPPGLPQSPLGWATASTATPPLPAPRCRSSVTPTPIPAPGDLARRSAGRLNRTSRPQRAHGSSAVTPGVKRPRQDLTRIVFKA